MVPEAQQRLLGRADLRRTPRVAEESAFLVRQRLMQLLLGTRPLPIVNALSCCAGSKGNGPGKRANGVRAALLMRAAGALPGRACPLRPGAPDRPSLLPLRTVARAGRDAVKETLSRLPRVQLSSDLFGPQARLPPSFSLAIIRAAASTSSSEIAARVLGRRALGIPGFLIGFRLRRASHAPQAGHRNRKAAHRQHRSSDGQRRPHGFVTRVVPSSGLLLLMGCSHPGVPPVRPWPA